MSPVATPAAAALAEDLAVVLIDQLGDPDTNTRIDEALADALEALERFVDADGTPAGEAAVGLTVGLVVDLRYGRLDRLACRVAAPLVIERLARAAGAEHVAGVLEPTFAVLGALTVVPDRAGPTSSATDPTPDPGLPAEVALGAAIADPARHAELLDVLASATLHVPVLAASVEDEHLALRLVPMVLPTGPVACAFTAPGRFHEVAAEAGTPKIPTMEVTGAELVELCPAGHGLALNPGCVLGTVLTEREVRGLASRVPKGR